MDRVARFSLYVLGGIWFLFELLISFVTGDWIEAARTKSERLWLILILVLGVAFVAALVQLPATPR